MSALTTRLRALRRPTNGAASGLQPQSSRITAIASWLMKRSWIRACVSLLSSFTGLAWGLLVAGVLFVAFGILMGWTEFVIPGVGALAILVAAILISFRRYQAVVDIDLSQERVTVGDVVTGRVTLTAGANQAIQPLQILLPVGAARVSMWTPRLKAKETFEEPFLLSTAVRGRITVGPACAVRADGLGVIRRVQYTSDSVDVFIHPRTVAIGAHVVGFIKDLEGVVTQDLSSSDVSFRALRDYVPGDDRRSIHWKTSARLDRLMVRQFEETRRAHLLLVLDCSDESWASAEEFEQGISAVASLIRVAAEQSIRADLHVHSGAVRAANALRLLDELSIVQMVKTTTTVRELATRAVAAVPQASVTVIVSGSAREPETLISALMTATQEMKIIGIRLHEDAQASIHTYGDGLILEMPTVDHLARSLNRVFA